MPPCSLLPQSSVCPLHGSTRYIFDLFWGFDFKVWWNFVTFIPSYSIFTDEDLSLQNVVYLLIVHTHYFCDFTDLARVADSILDWGIWSSLIKLRQGVEISRNSIKKRSMFVFAARRFTQCTSRIEDQSKIQHLHHCTEKKKLTVLVAHLD